MNNKEYLEYLIESYVAKNKTTDGLKEYLENINSLIQQDDSNKVETSSNSRGHQKVLNNYKGSANRYTETGKQGVIFNQQGLTNFFMLGFITLFFETIFILLSLCIY